MADDLTGAAELAGIAIRFGLRVQVSLEELQATDAEVWVISTDSRSMPLQPALEITARLTRETLPWAPALFFKKTDSVLRGHVMAELKTQMQVLGYRRALLMPANPSLGRTIENGIYKVAGVPLAETAFAEDPEFPVKYSAVKDLLENQVLWIGSGTPLPLEGICTGDARDEENLREWARVTDEGVLPAGGGDYFKALLERRFSEKEIAGSAPALPHLYVCGTAFQPRKDWVKGIQQKNGNVLYLPDTISADWLNAAVQMLKEKQRMILAIGDNDAPASLLRERMAGAVVSICQNCKPAELFVEGGSTASAVLHTAGIRQLQPLEEWSRGVVRMKAGDLYITIKPGSYPLPDAVAGLYQ